MSNDGGSDNRDEMRPVTVLFADIVGSTRLGERLSADEVKALVGECVSRMSRAVEEFGGFVQAYMGDGICAYFGVPAAHEDDPQRAARAALRILSVVGGYATEVEQAWGIKGFSVRVGINSGATAVGVVGAGDPQTVALGDVTNVAARLQSTAEPGSIATGDATARRLEAAFDLEPLGDVGVKGRERAVAAWRLVGAKRRADRPVGPSPPMVGRDEPLARLHEVVNELVAGRGQVLFVVGDTGSGKTRMLGELRSMIGESAIWLEGGCSSYGGDVPRRPFVEILRGWIGADEGDAEIAVRTKLRARMAGSGEADLLRLLPYLGLLLGVRPDPETERELLAIPADDLAESIRSSFREWVESLATTRPVVVAIGALQWADRPTRELLEDLLEVTDMAPLLLAVAHRSDPGSEAWRFRLRAHEHFGHRTVDVSLPPLRPEASTQLVDSLAPPGFLDDALRSEVIERAEGNPLYLEELVRAILEAGGGRRRTWTIPPGSAAELPPALEGLLVSRVDRLTPAGRRLAQVAAVIGREFPVRVADRVIGQEELAEGLPELLRADIVREIRRFPELDCAFRHGLLQEAALSTLTPAALRDLYGRVGVAFEELYPESLEERLERLAFYFYRSGEDAKALEYLERAADRAEGLDAPDSARELLGRAAKVATRLGDAAAERRIGDSLARLGGT